MATGQNITTNLQLARRADSSTVSMTEWQVIREQAATLVKTGFLPRSIETPEQALAIILTGRELGIGPMAALSTINVIQGKPTISPQLMLALINRTGEVESLSLHSGTEGATCTIKRRGQDAYTATFGPKEAAAMGLSQKDNYKKQPATMYKWRAIADAARSTFPDALLGLYTPDEMGAVVDAESGEVVDTPPPVRVIAPARPVETAPVSDAEPLAEIVDGERVDMRTGEILDSPEWSEIGAQPEEPKLSKASLLKVIHLTDKLEEGGCAESEWRKQLHRVTGKSSRKELIEGEMGEVLKLFAGMLNEIQDAKKKTRGK